jgi:hypothetical protein
MTKFFDILFDLCVLPALILVYLFLLIKISIELSFARCKYDMDYLLYLTKLHLDVAVSEYSLLMNTSFVIISSAVYYSLFYFLS